MSDPVGTTPRLAQRLGLWLGPIAALAVYSLLPDARADDAGQAAAGLTAGARAVAALAAWMACWWLTEAIPLEATSLLPLAILPLAAGSTIRDAAAPYADPAIFLFLGGFILGLSMERWGLHRRIALVVLSLVGTRPGMIVAGLMGATAIISMWVSNTATAVMMLPIGKSIADLLARDPPARADGPAGAPPATAADRFGPCAILGIAYAASIGGIGTPIGTPPNVAFVAFVSRESVLGAPLGFTHWLVIGLPVVALLLPLAWLILTRVAFRLDRRPIPGAPELVARERRALGPMSRGEWVTLCVFLAAVLSWIAREPLCRALSLTRAGPDGTRVALLSDAGIAIIAAVLLFVIPVDSRRGVRVMDWHTASRVPWGVLLLFGGGLSLAAAIDGSGLGPWIGGHSASLAGLPTWAIVLVVAAAVVLLSELASNTAVVTTLLPILYPAALTVGVDPIVLLLAVTLAASCGFMLPVATPPNTLAFASGYVRIGQMLRAGAWLNAAGVAVIVPVVIVLGARLARWLSSSPAP